MAEKKTEHAAEKKAEPKAPTAKEYVVDCQDGTKAKLVLTTLTEGDFPEPAYFQRWFTANADPKAGKFTSRVRGDASCAITLKE